MAEQSASQLFRPESLIARIRWLLLARVLVVTVFLGATAINIARTDGEPDFPLSAVAAAIVLAYLFSLGSVALLDRIERLRAFAYVQIFGDVALISIAVLLTGGLRSPMAVWYNLSIIVAALLLFRPGALITATASSITYGALMNLVYWGALPELLSGSPAPPAEGFGIVLQIAANIGSFFSIAFLSSILMERLVVTEQALEQSEASRLRIEEVQKVLVQNVESGVVTTDLDGRIDSVNEPFGRILGTDKERLLGRNIGDLFPVLRLPVGLRRLRDPTLVPTELRYDAGTGEPVRTFRCTGAPLTDTYQNRIGLLFILQDISSIEGIAPEEAASATASAQDENLSVEGLIGRSQGMKAVLRVMHKVAPTDSTALLTGESGTGKELVARAIHALSARREKPMVVVNCGAIPENLIESELFGHVRGASTGAVSDRRGLFRTADGGSIFLDEIGDLPLAMQVKLLRVLQERSFIPVGGQSLVAVDVRVIAATNRNLEADVGGGRFREDLFYRLNVIRIELPPLRERREDLPALIDHFLGLFCEVLGREKQKVNQAAWQRLMEYPYPGNIRELENVIEHATALSGVGPITEEDLPAKLLDPDAVRYEQAPVTGDDGPIIDIMHRKRHNLDDEIRELEQRFLEEALRRAGGVRKRAAAILGINYRSFRHRLSKYSRSSAGDRDDLSER